MHVQQVKYGIYKQEKFTPHYVSQRSKRYSCSVHIQLHNFFSFALHVNNT